MSDSATSLTPSSSPKKTLLSRKVLRTISAARFLSTKSSSTSLKSEAATPVASATPDTSASGNVFAAQFQSASPANSLHALEDALQSSPDVSDAEGKRDSRRKLSLTAKRAMSFSGFRPKSKKDGRGSSKNEDAVGTTSMVDGNAESDEAGLSDSSASPQPRPRPFGPHVTGQARANSPSSTSRRGTSFSGSLLSLKRKTSSETAATSVHPGPDMHAVASQHKRSGSGFSEAGPTEPHSRLSSEVFRDEPEEGPLGMPSPIIEESRILENSRVLQRQASEPAMRYRYRGSALTSLDLASPDVNGLNALDLASTSTQSALGLERLMNLELSFLVREARGDGPLLSRRTSDPTFATSRQARPFVTPPPTALPSRLFASSTSPLAVGTEAPSLGDSTAATLGIHGASLVPVRAFTRAPTLSTPLRAAPSPPITSNPQVGFEALGGVYGTYARPRPRLTSFVLPTLRNISMEEQASRGDGAQWALQAGRKVADSGEEYVGTVGRPRRADRLGWPKTPSCDGLKPGAYSRDVTIQERQRRRSALQQNLNLKGVVWLPNDLETDLGEQAANKFRRDLIRRYSRGSVNPLFAEDVQGQKDPGHSRKTIAYMHVFDLIPAGGRVRCDSAPAAVESVIAIRAEISIPPAQELVIPEATIVEEPESEVPAKSAEPAIAEEAKLEPVSAQAPKKEQWVLESGVAQRVEPIGVPVREEASYAVVGQPARDTAALLDGIASQPRHAPATVEQDLTEIKDEDILSSRLAKGKGRAPEGTSQLKATVMPDLNQSTIAHPGGFIIPPFPVQALPPALGSPRPESLRPPPPPRKRPRQSLSVSSGRSASPVARSTATSTPNGWSAGDNSDERSALVPANQDEGSRKRVSSAKLVLMEESRRQSRSLSPSGAHSPDENQVPNSALSVFVAVLLIWSVGALQLIAYTTSAAFKMVHRAASRIKSWARSLVFW